MRLFLFSFFTWVILTSCTENQTSPSAAPQTQIWTTYTYSRIGSDEGFWSMAIDTSRNVWVTPSWGQESNGVIKFDKINSTRVSPSNQIYFTNISCDSRNRIWTTNNPSPSSREKLYMYDEQGWHSYRVPDELPYASAYGIFIDDKDNVWLPFGNYFLKFDGARWTKFMSPNRSFFRDMTIDNDNNIWFGTDQGLIKFMYDSISIVRKVLIDKDSIPLSYCDPLFNKRTNELFVSTTYGLFRYNGRSWTQLTKDNSGLPCNDVMAMALDKRGELWVGTFCGIAKFSNEKFISYVSPLSKNSSDRTHQIILDNKGALWFYIYNEGIARLNNY